MWAENAAGVSARLLDFDLDGVARDAAEAFGFDEEESQAVAWRVHELAGKMCER